MTRVIKREIGSPVVSRTSGFCKKFVSPNSQADSARPYVSQTHLFNVSQCLPSPEFNSQSHLYQQDILIPDNRLRPVRAHGPTKARCFPKWPRCRTLTWSATSAELNECLHPERSRLVLTCGPLVSPVTLPETVVLWKRQPSRKLLPSQQL